MAKIKRVGKEICERLARFLDGLPSERDDTIDRLATMDGVAPEPSVPCTGSAMLAQACIAKIYGDGYRITRRYRGRGGFNLETLGEQSAGELLAATLDANQQSTTSHDGEVR